MPFSLLKFRLVFLPIFALASLIFANPTSKLFWANQIDSAILLRDSYFSDIGISSEGLDIESWDKDIKSRIISRMDVVPALANPWYNFLKGMLHTDTSGSGKDYFLKRTLFLTEYDPGATWVLFIEFSRYRQTFWSQKCINQLERQLLMSGARSSALISQMLIHYGLKSEKIDKDEAFKYYEWAKLFDPNQAYPYLRSALIKFPFDIEGSFSELGGYMLLLSKSWKTQLDFVSATYKWIKHTLVIFILIIFLILLIKYLPSALHYQIDLYPSEVSLTLRTILVCAIFSSVITFGILPFLWISAFLIWRFLSGKEKILFSIILTLLLLAPVDCYLRDMINSAYISESSMNSFSRATNEGYSEAHYKQVCRNSLKNPSDHLFFLAAATYEIKKGNFLAAEVNIEKALLLKPYDPVALITAGNLSFLSGETEKAQIYYGQAMENDRQRYASARFNQAQCFLKKMETITGTELINKAANMNPENINTFIRKNDHYFSKDWPALRLVLFEDYSPGQFWSEILPAYSGNWKSATKLWGTTFLGIPPLISFSISVLLFVILLMTQNRGPGRMRIKKIFECRFCGRVICKRCKTGLLCSSCHDETRFIRNEKVLEKMHTLIWSRFEYIRLIRRDLLEILFPGSGLLLEGKKSYSRIIPLLLLTSIIYASYVSFFSINSRYQLTHIVAVLILVTLFAYNILFITRRIPIIVQNVKAFLAQNSQA